jgi:hypothetical protein
VRECEINVRCIIQVSLLRYSTSSLTSNFSLDGSPLGAKGADVLAEALLVNTTLVDLECVPNLSSTMPLGLPRATRSPQALIPLAASQALELATLERAPLRRCLP